MHKNTLYFFRTSEYILIAIDTEIGDEQAPIYVCSPWPNMDLKSAHSNEKALGYGFVWEIVNNCKHTLTHIQSTATVVVRMGYNSFRCYRCILAHTQTYINIEQNRKQLELNGILIHKTIKMSPYANSLDGV